MELKFQIAKPSESLRAFVRYYKYVESDLTGTMKSVPVVSDELYFNFTHIRLFSPGYFYLDNPKVHMAGLLEYNQDAYSHAYGTYRGGGFAIVFQPMGFYNIFGIKSKDFFKYAVPCEMILNNEIINLWEKLQEFSNVFEMKEIVERFLLKNIKKVSVRPDIINNIFSCIDMYDGMITVSQLSKWFNTSTRSLQRQFRDDIGISPKDLMHIFRINKALRMMTDNNESDLSEIGYLSGYYDQSHFIRDIKKITGITPGKLKNNTNTKRVIADNRIFIKKS